MRRKCAVMCSAVGTACGSVRGRFQLSRSGLMGGSRSGYRQLGQHCHLLESLGQSWAAHSSEGIEEVQHHFHNISVWGIPHSTGRKLRDLCVDMLLSSSVVCRTKPSESLWKELLWSKSSSANRWFHTCPVKHYRSLYFLVLTSGCDAVIVPTVFALRMCVCLLFCYHILLIRMDRCGINRE